MATTSPPGRRPSLTGRAAILAFVLGAVVLSLALPARELLAQRALLDSLAARTSAAQASVADLQAQRLRWADPAFVRAQARERLHFVLPGEVGYVVLDPADGSTPGSTGPGGGDPAQAWYSRLWSTVEAAGATAPPAAPSAPAVRPNAPR